MKNVLQELSPVEKYHSYQIIHQVLNSNTDIQFKIAGNEKIFSGTFKKIGERKHFYISPAPAEFEFLPVVTIKIIINGKLFFLKTEVKKFLGNFYFDNYENMFELVRRKNPRFKIPKEWSQSAYIQSTDTKVIQPRKIRVSEIAEGLRSLATISELSKSGMKLNLVAELPRYEKNQIISIKFKLFRRAEIKLSAKIIHLNKNNSAGPTIGVQFIDDTILIKNKIQNICDDLAFYYTAKADR